MRGLNPVVNKRGKHYFAEVAIARGPEDLTGTGTDYQSIFGFIWALVLDKTQLTLDLYRFNDFLETWEKQGVISDAPHGGGNIRHISLAFDQNGRPIVAYQLKSANLVYIRRFDPVTGGFYYEGPFNGVDPLIINDATVNWNIPDSDILLFYLTPNRIELKMRVQRELYGTEHDIYTYSEQVFIDQVVALPLKLEIVGSTDNATHTNVVMQSEVYPIYLTDTLGTVTPSPPTGGAYNPIVVTISPETDTLGTVTFDQPPDAGEYKLVVVIKDMGSDTLGTVTPSPPTGGSYDLA